MSRKTISFVGLCFLVVGLVGCFLSFKNMTAEAVTVSKDYVITQSFKMVQLQADNAEIHISPTTDATTTVKLSGQNSTNNVIQFDSKVSGDLLTITLHNKPKNILDFNFIQFMNKTLTLTVLLPEQQYDSLNVDATNGKMDIEKVDVTHLKATTQNGLMIVKNTKSNDVNIQTNNGKLELDHVGGKLTGKTNNGEIDVKTADLDRPIDLQCANGKIDVKTDKAPTNTHFHAHVDNGKMNLLNKYSGDAVIGAGQNLVRLSTNNGMITVEQE